MKNIKYKNKITALKISKDGFNSRLKNIEWGNKKRCYIDKGITDIVDILKNSNTSIIGDP